MRYAAASRVYASSFSRHAPVKVSVCAAGRRVGPVLYSTLVLTSKCPMRRSLLACALSLAFVLPLSTNADDLQVGAASAEAPAPSVTLPKKGTLKSAVLKTYGQPQKQYAPVGGESPKHPPITRWDYAGFSVFFERDHVVDAVVPGHPAPVFHTETLQPASAKR